MEKNKLDKKTVKYLKGMSKVLKVLADEIEDEGMTKEHKETMSKIGSNILFNSCMYDYRVD